MESINEVLQRLKNDTTSGIRRVKYYPENTNESYEAWKEVAHSIIGDKFVLTDQIDTFYRNLLSWAHGYKKDYFEPEKGICIAGPTGVGKTACFKILQAYLQLYNYGYMRNGRAIPLRFHIFSALQIEADFAHNGFEGIEKYITYANVCIDDLGAEVGSASYFGNKFNVLAHIIEVRYDKGFLTHISTNLNEDMILVKYGDRVYSRIRQMTSFCAFVTKDFRLQGII